MGGGRGGEGTLASDGDVAERSQGQGVGVFLFDKSWRLDSDDGEDVEYSLSPPAIAQSRHIAV
jgi:hypothetical protein